MSNNTSLETVETEKLTPFYTLCKEQKSGCKIFYTFDLPVDIDENTKTTLTAVWNYIHLTNDPLTRDKLYEHLYSIDKKIERSFVIGLHKYIKVSIKENNEVNEGYEEEGGIAIKKT